VVVELHRQQIYPRSLSLHLHNYSTQRLALRGYLPVNLALVNHFQAKGLVK
jgi:hypothetical protein